ncbi:MAG: ParB/RepB/Spo0J family partition protein [Acidobacteriota bacterium]
MRGLPATKKMRHDSHFVDRLTARPSGKIGIQLPIDRIDPNPDQPRRHMQGIRQLVASIQEQGVLEPLLVRSRGDRFQIIAGERRFRAAQEAGLRTVPCVELDVDDRGCLEISLVENLQRRDLTPFEEADALAQLKEDFGYTQEQIARKIGRSRNAVSEMLTLSTVPQAIRDRCEKAGLRARSALVQIARLPDADQMAEVIDTAAREDLSRDELRQMLREDDRVPDPSHGNPSVKSRDSGYLFRYRDPERKIRFQLRFADRDRVETDELIATLKKIIADLRKNR